jgi:acetoin:2,6-dichlorophenolindophenol oxidoreductase subunit beta
VTTMTETVTLSQAFQQGMTEEMTRDETIFVIGTDLFERGGHFAQVKGLGPAFGEERVRDAPISEAAMVAAGVGAALNGMRPVIDLNFIDFVFGAMDEVVNQAAKARYMWGVRVPLIIRATSGVAYAGAQHNNSLEAWFAHTPGLLVAYPATPFDTKGLLKSALRGDDPVIFLMHKKLSGLRGEAGSSEDLVPFGQARIARAGRDVTIVGYGTTVGQALEAAENLEREGIQAEVIDLRTVAPIDMKTVKESVIKTNRLVVVGEAPIQCSVASEVAATIQEELFDFLDAPVTRLGGRHTPIPHSPPLIDAVIPQVAGIEEAARRVVGTGA